MMFRTQLAATTTATLFVAVGALAVGLATPARAQTVSIIFVEPVVPTQNDVAAVAENQVATTPARLADVKANAATEIAKRQRTLSELTGRVSVSTRDCGSNTAMLGEISSTASRLTALGQTIAAEADLTRARAEFQEIYTSFRVYLLVAPKAGKVVRCDAQLVRMDELRAKAAQIQATLNATRASGADVAAPQLALTQALASLGALNPAVAMSGIIGLVPDRGVDSVRAANSAALKASDGILDATNKALRDVNEQLDRVRKDARRDDHDADKARRELEKSQRQAEHDADKVRRGQEKAERKGERKAERKAEHDAQDGDQH